MERIKVSKNFYLDEFIDKDTYKRWGEKSIWFIDRDIISIAQFFREHFDVAITINGSGYNMSGFRPPSTDVGASLSQHRFGRAIDMKFNCMTIEEVYEEVMKNEKRFLLAGVRAVEGIAHTPTWLHVDKRSTDLNNILIVNP
jgi:hypothetical protein